MIKLDKNAHSVFWLQYQVVFVVKYRRKMFDNKILEIAKEIFEHISTKYNIVPEELNHDKDHVHILFRAHPKTEISTLGNQYVIMDGEYLLHF